MIADTVILIRTSGFDDRLGDGARRLEKMAGCPVCLAMDETRGIVPVPDDLLKLSITDDMVASLGVLRSEGYNWRCGDYPFYLARRQFPRARWFWQLEPDVRINFADEGAFFRNYAAHPEIDFLAAYLAEADKEWGWRSAMEPFAPRVFRCFFPVVRLSAPAIDHLLSRRQELTPLFEGNRPSGMWPNDEAFTASELANGNWRCADLNFDGTVYGPDCFEYYRAFSESFFIAADNRLYHSVRHGADFVTRLDLCLHAATASWTSADEKRWIMTMLRRPSLEAEIACEASELEASQFKATLCRLIESIAEKDATARAMRQGAYLLTSFGTLVYYNEAANKFQHAYPDVAPRNAWLVQNGDKVILMAVEGGHPPNQSEPDALVEGRRITFDFVTRPIGRGWFGLTAGEKFLSAAPHGEIGVVADSYLGWEKFEAITREELSERFWAPPSAAGGTELMLAALRQRVGSALDQINLLINNLNGLKPDGRPVVVWVHNSVTEGYDWMQDRDAISRVDRFIFVSNWQRQQFVDHFGLPPSMCSVLRNAIDVGNPGTQWQSGKPWRARCAYISAPYRGLDTLLEAWEELNPHNAELHVWSSLRLWGPNWDDSRYRALFSKANEMRNVIYHGIAPNGKIRSALREMHFMTMPTSFTETFCIPATEGMAAGCRIIAPSLAVLPETTAGFARMYPYTSDRTSHRELFMEALADELETPWEGQTDLAIAEHAYCKDAFGWDRRTKQWLRFIASQSGSAGVIEGMPSGASRATPPACTTNLPSCRSLQ